MTGQARVWVVDDDAEVRQLLHEYLGAHGYQVQLCTDSTALRKALEQELPDLVLLDLGLPGEDGLSLARFLRERHDLPVIMISGAGTPLDRTIGLEVGADDYWASPSSRASCWRGSRACCADTGRRCPWLAQRRRPIPCAWGVFASTCNAASCGTTKTRKSN
jgi:CheY-like chemotaxis protein